MTGLILIFHATSCFAVLIPLVYMALKNDAKTVFTLFLNDGNWLTTGLLFMIGLLVLANVLLGQFIHYSVLHHGSGLRAGISKLSIHSCLHTRNEL